MMSSTNTLQVYGWGRNEFRQLGIFNDSFDILITTPKPLINENTQFQITKIACGREHSIFITNDGKVYGVGRSSEGQLGNKFIKIDKVKKPEKISLDEFFIVDAAASDLCTLLLTNDGKVLCMGIRLGLLPTEKQNVEDMKNPYSYDTLKNEKIINIACGSLHCIAISEKGEVFTWGRGLLIN